MGAPKGNKFAKDNNGGRPREFDPELEAIEILKWAKTESALVLRMFAPLRGYHSATMHRWADPNDPYYNKVFCECYNIAKDLVGARRELKLIEANSSSPFQRYATFYDQALHKHERDEKKFDSDLKNETAKIGMGALHEVFNAGTNHKGTGQNTGEDRPPEHTLPDHQ